MDQQDIINEINYYRAQKLTEQLYAEGMISFDEYDKLTALNNRGCKSIVWRCGTRLDKKGECSARTVNEEVLKKAFITAINHIITDSASYIPILQNNIASVLRMSNPESEEAIQAKIDELQHQLVDCASQNLDYEDIAQEIFRLRAQKEQVSMNDNSRSENLKRIQEMQDYLSSQTSEITEFEEKLVKHLLEKVTVYEEKLVFEFKSGVSVEIEN